MPKYQNLFFNVAWRKIAWWHILLYTLPTLVFVWQAHWDLPEKNSKIPGDPSGLAWPKRVFGQMGHLKLAIKKGRLWPPLELSRWKMRKESSLLLGPFRPCSRCFDRSSCTSPLLYESPAQGCISPDTVERFILAAVFSFALLVYLIIYNLF